MFRAAFKSLFARKARLLLTAFSIVLGVGFVAGTYIFTDTIQKTFDELFADLFGDTDVVVQGELDFGEGQMATPPFDAAVLEEVLAVPGVDMAEGGVTGLATIVKPNGETVTGLGGAPSLAVSITHDTDMPSAGETREGRVPTGPGEIMIDAATAELHELAVGDRVSLEVPIGTTRAEIVGIFGFGDSDNLAGAVVVGFETVEAQRLLDVQGQYHSIGVVATSDVSPQALQERIAAVLPGDVEAVVAAEQAETLSDEVGDALAPLTNSLLAFAAVALLTGAFIIQNTFRILMSQRTQELALMRAVGASGRQVVAMVVVEALVVALVASGLGILFGMLVASLITSMFAAIGLELATVSAPLLPRTIIAAFIVGIGVTLASVLPAAVRASRVPPLAALRKATAPAGSLRRRGIVGGLVVAAGLAVTLNGLFGDVPDVWLLNEEVTILGGALIVFIGVSIMSAIFVRPFAIAVAAPIKRLGRITGRLARENSIRRPRRTAATAAALMIGLASITFFGIFQASNSAAVEAAIDDTMRADFLLTAGFQGVSPDLRDELAAATGVEDVLAVRMGMWDDSGSVRTLAAVDPAVLPAVLELDMQEGSIEGLEGDGMLVEAAVASDKRWAVGDTVEMGFAHSGRTPVEVVGTFDSAFAPSAYLVGMDLYEENFTERVVHTFYVARAEGASHVTSRAAVDAAANRYASVDVYDVAELKAEVQEDLDKTLLFITGLLVFAVIIALLGIANTLVLSVFERTREIGLLRAVGMSRRQVRRMVRWEALIVALLGGVLGIAIGGFFGMLIVLSDDALGLATLRVPIGMLVTVLVGAVIAGMLASVGPARKAARQDILRAIAYE